MQQLLGALKAAADSTRLRILALCAQGELTVSELVLVLGQSQPRVSRHLKLLTDAGLLERHREGNWIFYAVAGSPPTARALLDLLPQDAPDLAQDRAKLADVRQRRAEAAASYFGNIAGKWDAIRSMHVDAAEVERTLLELAPPEAFDTLLDVGTGTGRIVELLAPRVRSAIGVDLSREMLAVARDRIGYAGRQVALRHGNMYALPLPDASADLVTLHLVLHYAEDPEAAIVEAARALRPGGRMIVVDFARHGLEELREHYAHRRLGFDQPEVTGWFARAGLVAAEPIRLAGDPLTVMVWVADRPQPDGRLRPLAGGTGRQPSVAASPWI